ncbi:Hypothetical_protein [Hexamita inflata]|uniref:Hypothetical_protein n=1 Tax=Hexamita inflata TaxID=28002 RepID=A0AA86QTF5_9EUKA|nr:Hypothetical protein HINF_LOCUS46868 [Hexamita inflata]
MQEQIKLKHISRNLYQPTQFSKSYQTLVPYKCRDQNLASELLRMEIVEEHFRQSEKSLKDAQKLQQTKRTAKSTKTLITKQKSNLCLFEIVQISENDMKPIWRHQD